MRFYFIPVAMPLGRAYFAHRDNHNLETVDDLERFFDEYQGEWLIFDDKQSAKKHITAASSSPEDLNILPIYELEAGFDYKKGSFGMHLSSRQLRQMAIYRKNLLSVTIDKTDFTLNRERLEPKAIERLRTYLLNFQLDDCQKKAAHELVNCLIALKGKDRDRIVTVVGLSIDYIEYRNCITKEAYEKRAEWYLIQPSENLQFLGKAMLAIAFAIPAVALMAATASISIPVIVVIPSICLLGMGFFAAGCKRSSRLSNAMHEFANAFESRSNNG